MGDWHSTKIINTKIININTKLIQLNINTKLELLQSLYNCTWIWSKVKKKTCQGPSPRIYIKLCEVIEERNHFNHMYVIKIYIKEIQTEEG